MGREIKEKCVSTYLVFMLLVFPLFYRNNYIDILRAKRDFFLIATGIFVLCMMFLEGGMGRRESSKEKGDLIKYLAVGEICVLLISTLKSGKGMDAFLGLSGRYLGALTMMLGIVAMLWIGKYLVWSVALNWCFLCGSGAVFLLQILNQCHLDILRMKVNLVENLHYDFLSTIGNKNFNATFDSMMLSVGMVFYLLCKEKFSKKVYGAWLFLGFLGMVCCRSDSVYLGVGTAFVILFGYAFEKKEYMESFSELFGILTAAFFVLWIYPKLFGAWFYPMDGLALYLLNGKVIVAGMVISVFGKYIVCGKREWRKQELWKKRQKGYAVIVLGMLAVGIYLFMHFNMFRWNWLGDGWASYFYIDDTWGTYRGYVWKRSAHIFWRQPLWEKIFGSGMTGFGDLMELYYGADAPYGKFIDAHSEMLQFLITTGILGVIFYFGMLCCLLIKSVRAYPENEFALFGILAIAAFLAQGLVNNPQAATTPILFVGLGIFLNILQRENPDKMISMKTTERKSNEEKFRCLSEDNSL